MPLGSIRAADRREAPRAEGSAGRRIRPPAARTSFIGRAPETALLLRLLRTPGVRLVTITGRSGAGKTRLASEVGRVLDPELPGGTVFLDCSAIDRPGLVPAAVAAALDLQVPPGQRPEDALASELRWEPCLILADDLDHVPGGADILLGILDEAPETRVLATASAPLRTSGERIVRLAPLPLPAGDDLRPEVLQTSPAVALFCERAGAVDATFRCTVENAPAVAELCARLDGLPLAIELAAARVPTLPPAAQLETLSRMAPLDLRPLGGGGPDRHRELRAAIAWSHRLAGETERIVLRRMAAFDGWSSLEALRAVCAGTELGEAAFLDALTDLVDLHLVEPDGSARAPRYRLLPTVAEFACEQLAAGGEADRIAGDHAAWFAALARRAASLDDETRLRRLRADRENLHRALGHLVTVGDTGTALRLATHLAPLWLAQGLFGQTRIWFDELLDAAEPAGVPVATRAIGHLWAAVLASQHGTGEDARRLTSAHLEKGDTLARASGSDEAILFADWCVVATVFLTRDVAGFAAAAEEGLAVARRTGDERWEVRFMTRLAMVAQRSGDVEMAARLGSEALRRASAGADRATIVAASLLLHSIPRDTPGLTTSLPALDALLPICRGLGDTTAEAWVLTRLAAAAAARGEAFVAADRCAGALRLARRSGGWNGAAMPVVVLARLASSRGDDLDAARLHGSILPILESVELGLTPGPAEAYRASIEVARARLGAEAFDAAASAASLLSGDEAVAAALAYATSVPAAAAAGTPVPAPPDHRHEPRQDGRTDRHGRGRGRERPAGVERLTPRELDVLRLLAAGDTNKEIAAALGLTAKTVMHHSVSIYSKLGVRGRAEATAWAYRRGVVGGSGAG